MEADRKWPDCRSPDHEYYIMSEEEFNVVVDGRLSPDPFVSLASYGLIVQHFAALHAMCQLEEIFNAYVSGREP
jgi:hypothetical protein